MKKITLLSFFMLLAAASCFAGNGDINSCYDSKITVPTSAQSKEIFILVDQTTLLDDQLKQSVANQIRPFIVTGNNFSVLVFSAFTQGKYTQLLTSGQLDQTLSIDKRNDISKPVLAKFDQCMAHQPAQAMQAVGKALRAAFDGTSGDIAKSDIMGSLKDIAGKVKQSSAREKVVFLVSDMLENSSVSSFYEKNSVRKIDPNHEMKLAIDNHMIADFGGARLYVLGAGLLSDDGKSKQKAYRDPKTMQALANFWKMYFDQSKAELVEFGEPALLNQIK